MLREYRKRKNITQEKLAEMINIDPRTILRIEKDLVIPKIDTYAKMVTALDMTDEEIGANIRNYILGDKK